MDKGGHKVWTASFYKKRRIKMNKPEKIELFAKYLSGEFNSLKLDDEYYLWELWEGLGITNKDLKEISNYITEKTGVTFNFKEKSFSEFLEGL